MYLYGKDFAYMIKLRVLRLRVYSGFSRWALNIVTSVFLRENQRKICYTHRGEGDVKTKQRYLEILALKIRIMWL